MNFEERKEKFQKELLELVDKYGIDIYAINAVMPNGEVLPVVKMSDTKEELKEEKDGYNIKE